MKTKIIKLLKYLNSNGFYKLENDKDAREIYLKAIDYYKTKTNTTRKSNIVQIKSIVGKNGQFLAETKINNPNLKQTRTKKGFLNLEDRKILSLLKDYEYMLKGSLKHVQDLYCILYNTGVTDKDYSKEYEEDILEDIYKHIIEKIWRKPDENSISSKDIEINSLVDDTKVSTSKVCSEPVNVVDVDKNSNSPVKRPITNVVDNKPMKSSNPVSKNPSSPVNRPSNSSPVSNPVNRPSNSSPVSNPVNIPSNSSPVSSPVNIPSNSSPVSNPVNRPINLVDVSKPTFEIIKIKHGVAFNKTKNNLDDHREIDIENNKFKHDCIANESTIRDFKNILPKDWKQNGSFIDVRKLNINNIEEENKLKSEFLKLQQQKADFFESIKRESIKFYENKQKEGKKNEMDRSKSVIIEGEKIIKDIIKERKEEVSNKNGSQDNIINNTQDKINNTQDLGISEDLYIENDSISNSVEDHYVEEDENTGSVFIESTYEGKTSQNTKEEDESKCKKFKYSSQEKKIPEKEKNERLKLVEKTKKINFANLLVFSRFD
ncbi:hypothetical protein NGRA_1437 [Nosema granulosis]|uniref:Uncharacterized protein n=1 Tax=Nosema granulosis TaxID=83296 RepID=A0A9P6KYM0_9MICR|nr:hypothetical protein NGRA_1437 [Nosema granulosis]